MLKFVLALLGLLSSLAAFAADSSPGTHGLLLDAVSPEGRTLIAVGEHGRILRSSDSGRSWELIPSPTAATLTALSFADVRCGWAVGHDGIILNTRDGGLSWTQQFSDKTLSFLAVHALDNRRVFAVGAFGTFYRTEDGGANWSSQKVQDEELHLNSITALSPAFCLITGERGTLLKFSTTHTSFTPVPAGYDGSFFGALAVGPEAVLVYGLRGRVFRSDGPKILWQAISLERPTSIQTAVKLKTGTVVLAGQARAFFVSMDNGRTFLSWDPKHTTAVAKLLEAPDGTLVAFGEAGATRLESPEAKAP